MNCIIFQGWLYHCSIEGTGISQRIYDFPRWKVLFCEEAIPKFCCLLQFQRTRGLFSLPSIIFYISDMSISRNLEMILAIETQQFKIDF